MKLPYAPTDVDSAVRIKHGDVSYRWEAEVPTWSSSTDGSSWYYFDGKPDVDDGDVWISPNAPVQKHVFDLSAVLWRPQV